MRNSASGFRNLLPSITASKRRRTRLWNRPSRRPPQAHEERIHEPSKFKSHWLLNSVNSSVRAAWFLFVVAFAVWNCGETSCESQHNGTNQFNKQEGLLMKSSLRNART